MPEDSRQIVLQLADRLSAVGLGAFVEVGLPGQPVLGLPSSPGRIGSVVIGGLNPIAILEEMGYRVYSRALSGLFDYSRMFSYEELPDALAPFLNAAG